MLGGQVMPVDQVPERGNDNAAQAIERLKAVVDGATYDAVAARFGVTRTAVERRIKAVAVRLSKTVGIEGLTSLKYVVLGQGEIRT